MTMTPQEIYERYNVRISQEQLDEFRELRRRAEGPPFRMTIEYPRPVLTEEAEAAELAQAEHDDIMGNFGFDPEDYMTLRAQNADDAKREAEERWCSRQQPADAIGYDIWRADWSGVYSFRVGKDRAGEV
jgi:hypothetical protein